MVRIALDAGHGYNTAGKRTPDGMREWSFNSEVILAAIERLNTYKDVEILRLDDPTGKTDVSLKSRTDKANAWKASVLVSGHHNASTGVWHSGGGVETFVYTKASQTSKDVAKAIHKRVVAAMGLRDRGVKTADFHITREAKMPAVLVEGGFMDSTVDIRAMRDNAKLKAQGFAIADGIAEVFKLQPKTNVAKDYVQDGDKNALVTQLQAELNKQGFRLTADGIFGKATEVAVKDFQRKHGLTVDGIAGKSTFAKLAEVNKPKPAVVPIVKPVVKPVAPKSDVYRVSVDGKQVGAYANSDNVSEQVAKAIGGNAKNITIDKV